MEMAAKAQVREQALEHVLETLCSSLDDVQSCLRLASTNKALNVLVGEGSFWRRFFAEAVQVVVLACECAGVAMADVEARPRAVSAIALCCSRPREGDHRRCIGPHPPSCCALAV